MKAFIVLRLGDRTVLQKFSKKSFFPQEKLMILFLISQLFPCQILDCYIDRAIQTSLVAKVKIHF